MDPIEIQFNNYAHVFSYLEIFGLAFLLAIVSETLWDIISGSRKKLGETFANTAIAIVNALLERTFYGLVFIIGLAIAAEFAFFGIPHTWWSWPLAIIVADLTYYWMHRAEHEIRILWAHHSVHHSSPEFNFTTAIRLSWTETLIEWIFFVPMILLGFSLVQTIIALSVILAYQSWIHTEKVRKLGWLDHILNTPSVHRVHHGSNTKYINKNYGGLFIFWDKLFGTYEAETEKVIYGITTPVNSYNPIKINFDEYRKIVVDVRKAKSMGEALGYIFYGPGWKPEKNKSK